MPHDIGALTSLLDGGSDVGNVGAAGWECFGLGGGASLGNAWVASISRRCVHDLDSHLFAATMAPGVCYATCPLGLNDFKVGVGVELAVESHELGREAT